MLQHVAALQVPFAGSMQLVCLGRKDRQADLSLLERLGESSQRLSHVNAAQKGPMMLEDVGSTGSIPSSHSELSSLSLWDDGFLQYLYFSAETII